MVKRVFVPTVVATFALAGTAFASGQPNASCESAGANPPPGFATAGFANAETHYAGSDGTPSAANGSDHAVSQYDIACFGGAKP